jgi:hypothetical protein
MAKKSKQHASGAGADSGAGEARTVDPNLAAFAAFVRGEERKERDAKKAAKDARAKEQEAGRLVAAKDEAAANLKRIRSRSGVSAEERDAAETAYRTALAAVVAAETGTAPEWAPPAPEPEADAAPASSTDDGEDAADPAEGASSDDEPTAEADDASA